MVYLRRITTGIRSHFTMRVTEWIMLVPTLLLGAIFMTWPGLFEISPSFEALARIARQEVWGIVMLLCAIVRLVALTINGSFDAFRYSPHFRLAASIVGAMFWMVYDMAHLSSTIYFGGAPTGAATVAVLVLLEFRNVYVSSADMGE